MKICDVTQFYSPVGGGVRRYVGEKQKFVNREGGHEHVLIIPGERHGLERVGRCAVYTVGSPRVDRTSRYRVILDLERVRQIVREERPDVIESGDPYHVAWGVLREAERWDIPIAGFYHSHFPDAYLRTVRKFAGRLAHDFVQDYAQRYIRRLYSRFDRTLIPSPHLKNLLESWGVDNAVVVKLGVDVELFHPGPAAAETRERLGVPKGRFLLLSVGRLAAEKNVATLLGAFEILHARAPGRFQLCVIGDGPLRHAVRDAQQRTGSVTWRRYCADSRELAAVYRAADLFVHPGVLETFGLVTVEAQACGTPVAGIRGTFMDRLAFVGLEAWAEANTAAALAAAVERFAEMPLREMGLAAAARAAEDFAWPRVFTDLFGIYSEMAASRRRGRASDSGR